jgi:hypothetical protein
MHTDELSKRILVVGDWVIDENWIVGQHRNTTSSRVGDDYTRVLNTPQSSMQSLCGAGLVASILREGFGQEVPIDIWGLGLWHSGDTKRLDRMLNTTTTFGKTHHQLVDARTAEEVGPVRLVCLNGPDDEGVVEDTVGTTRVIRIYELSRGKPRLKQRIDWTVPLDKDRIVRVIKNNAPIALKQLPDFDYIVVKDLVKGVVSPALISLLAQKYPRAKWYISSKVWKPQWLAAVKTENILLYVIPQVAAQLALNDAESRIDCWLTPQGVPSKEGLISLQGAQFPHTRIVVLPGKSRVLAYDGIGTGYVQSRTQPSDILGLTQMASVLLPALIAYDLRLPNHETNSPNKDRFQCILEKALAYTDAWRTEDEGRITKNDWRPQRLPFDGNYDENERSSLWHPFSWQEMIGKWEAAFEGHGIVDNEFHLWRGMTELDQYVSCVPEKRKHIQLLLREGHQFANRSQRDRKHQSYLIFDQPGSGKTFLIDRLASALNMEPLKFNLTQFADLQDLLNCFEKIRSQQEHHKDSKLMVFFDEINAKSTGASNYFFGGFLETIDTGDYTNNGITHRLQPCFWIFAGTQPPTHPQHASTKYQDFESRLARKPMVLSGDTKEDEDLRRVERVYMGVAAIRRQFSDVSEVSDQVLWVFKHLNKELGPRDIARIVRNCENVQYGRLGLDQLPEDIVHLIPSDRKLEWLGIRRHPEKFLRIVDEPPKRWESKA